MPRLTQTPKTLRKFIAQPNHYAERYGNFNLTQRDLKILDTVYRYRYMEARHIRALIDGSGQQITRRLQGLFHNKYLGRYSRRERMRLELAPGAPLMAYGLELKGASALQGHYDRLAVASESTPASVVWRKDHTRRKQWFLEHHLMISDFRCALDIELRGTSEMELVTWDQSKSSWFQVTIPGKRRRFLRVAPDAYFTLRTRGRLRHYFLEADRSTEEHRRLRDKFVAYWWHLQNPCFADLHEGRPRVNVLFVTTGEKRLQNMLMLMRQMRKPNRADHGGKGSFWFCVDQDYELESPTSILGPIWRTANAPGTERRSLFRERQLRNPPKEEPLGS